MARWRSVNHPEVEEVVEQVRQVYDVSILPPHIRCTRLKWPGGSGGWLWSEVGSG